MNNEQMSALRSLSSDGYAVIVWSPEELGDVSATLVQGRSIELGHQIIEDLSEISNGEQREITTQQKGK